MRSASKTGQFLLQTAKRTLCACGGPGTSQYGASQAAGSCTVWYIQEFSWI